MLKYLQIIEIPGRVKKPITLFCLLLLFLPAIGQHYSISGTVFHKDTGEALPGANIIVSNGYLATVSASDGSFSFDKLKKGTYSITVSYVGYQTHETTIELDKDITLKIELTPTTYLSEEVIISAIRAGSTPKTTYETITADQIGKRNSGRDLPYFMETLPSVVVNSDAGNGVGYTGMTIRGTDLTRINVTLNGVPVNDAESHAVFFVDLPDLASSVDDIRVQRGVGSSTNGAASFGASINIKTGKFRQDPYGEFSSSAGSFNTFRNTLALGTGLIRDKWVIDGRFSMIQSDGYIDRASSDLKSMYLSGGYYGKKDVVKLIGITGTEKTYQAWYGVPKDSLSTNRTFNPAGMILDPSGDLLGYYDNQTDNYRQTYLQLHWGHEFNRHIDMALTAFYTRGIGYYENYRNSSSFAEYGWSDTVIGTDTISITDMIDQKWLDNHFYGVNVSAGYSGQRLKLHFGAGLNHYDGDHYGYVIWSQIARVGEFDLPWYQNRGLKTDLNLFGKADYHLTEHLIAYLDLQFRYIDYDIEGTHDDLRNLTQHHVFSFFNPKVGLSYRFNPKNEINLYGGIANREPNRSVYRDADPNQDIRPERLYDIELGYSYRARDLSIEMNAYYMYYTDQLVMTGKINNVGAAIMTNVPKSYRAGLELIGAVNFLKIMNWQLNVTLSQNKILNYVNYTDNWDTWPEQVIDTIGTTNISFSPDLVGASRLSAKPVKGFSIALVSKYVGRQYIDNTSSREVSLDPWLVHNIEFLYTLNPRFIRQVDFWLHLNNIFNEKYASYAWVYRYVYDGAAYEMNGFFPQATFNFKVGLNIKF